MLNEGADAWRPEVYGDRIIIERKFGSSGAMYNFYSGDRKISNWKEKKGGTKEELKQMTTAFSLFADNPCCVLTQEFSKKFLNGNDNEKYNFFIEVIIQ